MAQHLAENDGASSFMRLHAATTTAKGRSGTSKQVHTLERLGYVTLRRSWDGFDGRDCRPYMHITLTAAGRAALEKQTTPRAPAPELEATPRALALEVHP